MFLDDLRAEFERIKSNKNQLRQFHQKLAGLRFLDPACGCGNFLVIAYRELRLLEIEVLKALRRPAAALGHPDPVAGGRGRFLRHRDQRVARPHRGGGNVADGPPDEHPAFGGLRPILRAAAADEDRRRSFAATRCGWTGRRFFRPEQCSYVLGNPPFVGKQFATAEQKADMELVCGGVKGGGVLDYVTAWYFKAAEYIQDTSIVVGFVSTNSITQGEQVGVLWNELFTRYRLKIHFAHRTFAWESEARGKAHVHVVIIGFGACDTADKRIYDYETNGGETVTVSVAATSAPISSKAATSWSFPARSRSATCRRSSSATCPTTAAT